MNNQILYNLPKEKLIGAFKTELQTLCYNNVSINHIINNTRIFYQYFDSIKDLYNKILKDYENENSRAISIIKKHNDNILKIFYVVDYSTVYLVINENLLSIIYIALKLKYNIELELKVVETSIIPYKE